MRTCPLISHDPMEGDSALRQPLLDTRPVAGHFSDTVPCPPLKQYPHRGLVSCHGCYIVTQLWGSSPLLPSSTHRLLGLMQAY